MTESQPWEDNDIEPEIEDETETDADTSEGESSAGAAGGMCFVAMTLSAVVVAWALFGTVPRPVLYLAGLWIMAATITSVAEVYAA